MIHEGKSAQSIAYAEKHGIPYLLITRVYIVHEQWPHQDVVCFRSLDDALTFAHTEHHLSLPIVLMRNVTIQMGGGR